MPLQRRNPDRPPRRSVREIPWAELRRHAATVFAVLQAGWFALDDQERSRASELLRKSKGRPRNLSRTEARELGALAGRAGRAAAAARRH